jgi:hypothetical protein
MNVAQIKKVSDIFAYNFLKSLDNPDERLKREWDVWSEVKREFQRMQLKEDHFRVSQVINSKGSNIDYQFPVFVPSKTTDSQLVMACPIRKKGRFPALSYFSKVHSTAIWRSSELTSHAF